eukprot:c40418_g1_i1 orf=20-325(+)
MRVSASSYIFQLLSVCFGLRFFKQRIQAKNKGYKCMPMCVFRFFFQGTAQFRGSRKGPLNSSVLCVNALSAYQLENCICENFKEVSHWIPLFKSSDKTNRS